MQSKPSISRVVRGLAVVAALTTVAHAAQAASYILTANGSTGSTTAPGGNFMDAGNANGGDFFASPSSAGGGLFFHTYGSSSFQPLSYFGARVSGDGTFYGKTSASYFDAYTNTSGAAQNVTFAFNVDSGGLTMAGSGTGFADLDLNVRFNGTTVARDHTRIDGTTCANTADDVGTLGSYMSCTDGTQASGAGGLYSVSYLLAAGDTLNVQYDIVSEVQGMFVGGDGVVECSGGGGIELARVAAATAIGNAVEGQGPGESGCQYFNVMARSGDPASFSPVPFAPAAFRLSAAAVPEPGSLALAGLAFAALLGAGRKRAARQG